MPRNDPYEAQTSANVGLKKLDIKKKNYYKSVLEAMLLRGMQPQDNDKSTRARARLMENSFKTRKSFFFLLYCLNDNVLRNKLK